MGAADTWWDERRFDPGPALRERFADWEAAAECFGTTERTIMRWIEKGLNWVMADEFACHLGLHPRQLWPEWDQLPPEVMNDPLPPHQPKLMCECRICTEDTARPALPAPGALPPLALTDVELTEPEDDVPVLEVPALEMPEVELPSAPEPGVGQLAS